MGNRFQFGFKYSPTLNTAQNTNKLILVDVHAPWCGYCKEMDKNTLQDARVTQKLSNYVLLKSTVMRIQNS